MLISAYKSCLKGVIVAPRGPDVVDILQKVNKSRLLKENQKLNFVRFQTSQFYFKPTTAKYI